MTHTVESKAENYEKLFVVKCHQNLWNYSSLAMLRFFLCSVYSKTVHLITRVNQFVFVFGKATWRLEAARSIRHNNKKDDFV